METKVLWSLLLMFSKRTRNLSLSVVATIAVYGSTGALAQEALGTPDDSEMILYDDDENSQDEIELGRQLFFDKRLSLNSTHSCASCHNPDIGFGDGLVKSIGADGRKLARHTPHLYNLAWNVIFMWDGRDITLESQALSPITSEAEMNMPIVDLVARLSAVDGYKDGFKQAFGAGKIDEELIGRALAAFQRTLVINDTPFDRYMGGDELAMSEEAIKGLELFKNKANCIACHDGSNFTDNSFHNIGLKSRDLGRYQQVKSAEMKRAFKTPGLRNVLLTAPYMHDGSLSTLEEVVRFYNRGGDRKRGKSKLIQPLQLNDEEIIELIAFLGALTQPLYVTRPVLPR